MKKKIFTTMAIATAVVASFGQSAISAAGFEASGDGTLSATIGQTAFMAVANENGSISQGVQQAYEITTETGIDVTEIQLSAYPNPTSDVLNLQINGEFGTVAYALYTNTSKRVAKGVVNGSETQIQMGAFKPGLYFLDVKADGKTVKRFKIIKN
ncbi:MAG: T9SS type A sorting domain-containing protein [Bacteroidales bacterium]|nr:T9SS type A sorting domain-containing protein [Bacteroidales bacterium]